MEIEKGIPFVDGRSLSKGNTKYPWHDMEVGDSFLVKDVSSNTLSTTARYHNKRTGKKFRVSTMPDGVRVWRIA